MAGDQETSAKERMLIISYYNLTVATGSNFLPVGRKHSMLISRTVFPFSVPNKPIDLGT